MQRHIKWEENSSRWSVNEINKVQFGHRLGKKKKKAESNCGKHCQTVVYDLF